MRLTISLLSTLFILGLVGCGGSSSPETPEEGSIEAFLEANPDYTEEGMGEPTSEREVFDAAGGSAE